MSLTILEGATFRICDERGDVGAETSGFFTQDTRFLSIMRLAINGQRPLLLSSAKVEYFSAAFFLRNPLGGLPQDTLSITRRRFVSEAMQDQMMLQNQGAEPIRFKLTLEFGSDFADIFTVKSHDFALGDPLSADPLPPLVTPRFDAEQNQFVLEDTEDSSRTQIVLSRPGTVNDSSVTYAVELEPRERWELFVDVVPSTDGDVLPAR